MRFAPWRLASAPWPRNRASERSPASVCVAPLAALLSDHAVATAFREGDRQVNDAAADAMRTRGRGDEDFARVARRAESGLYREIEDARAGRDAFVAWHRVRARLAAAEEAALA